MTPRGLLVLGFSTIAVTLAVVGLAVVTGSTAAVLEWFGALSLVGVFSLLLAAALVSAVVGFLVIRRATPR